MYVCFFFFFAKQQQLERQKKKKLSSTNYYITANTKDQTFLFSFFFFEEINLISFFFLWHSKVLIQCISSYIFALALSTQIIALVTIQPKPPSPSPFLLSSFSSQLPSLPFRFFLFNFQNKKKNCRMYIYMLCSDVFQ